MCASRNGFAARDSCRRQLEVKNVAVFDEIRKIREIREIRPAGNGGFPLGLVEDNSVQKTQITGVCETETE